MSKQGSSFPEMEMRTKKSYNKPKKIFIILFRYKRDAPKWCIPKEWAVWSKYRKEKSRNEALKALKKNNRYMGMCEFKKG